MKNQPKRQRQNVFLWIFLAVVFVGFAAYSLSFTMDNDTTDSSAAEATTAPAPDPTESSNDDQLFHGIACEPDCSDQQDGYNDAQSNNVKSRDDCPSDARTYGYRQGCWAYADEQMSKLNQPAQPNQSDQSNPSDQSDQSDQGSP